MKKTNYTLLLGLFLLPMACQAPVNTNLNDQKKDSLTKTVSSDKKADDEKINENFSRAIGANVPAVYQKITSATDISMSSDNNYVIFKVKGRPENHKSDYYKDTIWDTGDSSTLYEQDKYTNINNPATGTKFAKNGGKIIQYSMTFTIPVTPNVLTTPVKAPNGPMGVTTNGVSIYSPYNQDGSEATQEAVSFDSHGAHPDPYDKYHYHIEPKDLTSGSNSSALVGFMAPGTNTPALDDYGGHTHATADFPNGVYHYHVGAKKLLSGYYYFNTGYFRGTQGTVSYYPDFNAQNWTSKSLTGLTLSNGDFKTGTFNGTDFTSATLTGSDFTSANLTNANLTTANLTNANLTSTTLTGATITGSTLTGANFTGANLTTVKGYNGKANDFTSFNFTSSNLTSANLASTNFISANLTSANLTGATLTGTKFKNATLTGANFTNDNLTTFTGNGGGLRDFTAYNLSSANFTGANLTAVRLICNLNNTNFTNANLTSAVFDYGEMWHTILTGATMKSDSFKSTNMTNSKGYNGTVNDFSSFDFTGSSFDGTNFTGSNLSNAKFNNSTFTNSANFTNANLSGANFTGATMTSITLTGANLSGATWTDGRVCASGSTGTCN
jgi:uncharacterized protein YjbI with pentapeptide repeats